MPEQQNSRGPAATLMTMRIIAGAMMSGVLMFAVVVLFLRNGPPAEFPLLSYLGAGAAVVAFVLRMVIPDLVGRSVLGIQLQQVQRDPADGNEIEDDRTDRGEAQTQQLLAAGASAFQTRTIVDYALLEGAAFFNLVAFMIEGQWWGFAAVGLLLACMVLAFPTLGRLEHWIQNQPALTE